MHDRACRAASHEASRMVRPVVRAHALSVAWALSSLAAGDASLLRSAQHAAGLPTTGFTSEYACAAATLAPNDRVSPPASDDRGARRISCERDPKHGVASGARPPARRSAQSTDSGGEGLVRRPLRPTNSTVRPTREEGSGSLRSCDPPAPPADARLPAT